MKEIKCTVELGVLNLMIERVHEDNLPIEIVTGHRIVDYNGDTQVDVMFEYAEEYGGMFRALLAECMNLYTNLPNDR
jgi:hypothetical protein